MKKGALIVIVMVCSPAILALATIVAPQIGLLLLGLAFLGIAPAGIVTVIGILLSIGGIMRVFPAAAGASGIADLLLA